MYRIGVLTDSHGKIDNIRMAIKRMGRIDAIYFLGDFVSDLDFYRKISSIPIICVKGNCDIRSHEKTSKITDNFGVRIMLTHGHKFRVKLTMIRLGLRAQSDNLDLICFGHTHISKIESDGRTIFFNPGSCSGYNPTYGIIEIQDGLINPTIFSVYDNE